MTRLAAIEKMLYYPTQDRVLRELCDVLSKACRYVPPWSSRPRLSYVSWTDSSSSAEDAPARLPLILDPCAGKGEALAAVGAALDLPRECLVAVELDEARADEAELRVGHLYRGSALCFKVRKPCFDAIWLNPPYASDRERGSRQEVTFAVEAWRWVSSRGMMISIIPRRLVDDVAAAIDSTSSSSLKIDHFCVEYPEPEASEFGQAILFSRATDKYTYRNAKPEVQSWAKFLAGLNDLGGYTTGAADLIYQWYLRVSNFKQTDTVRQRLSGVQMAKFDVTTTPPLTLDKGAWATPNIRPWIDERLRGLGRERTPLVTPRPGHLALLLASGNLNGVEVSGPEGERLLLSGHSMKESYEADAYYNSNGAEVKVTRERIQSVLTTLDLDKATLTSWTAAEDADRTKFFFETFGERLLATVNTDNPPQFDVTALDVSKFDGINAPKKLEGRPQTLLRAQMEAAAAIAHGLGENKYVVLSGEMGVGKTTISTSAMLLLFRASESLNQQKVIVMCPSHLVTKWQREINAIVGYDCSATAKTLTEVDDFFESLDTRFLVLSKETAKLGARWEPAVARYRPPVKANKEEGKIFLRKRAEDACPSCGTPTGDVSKTRKSRCIVCKEQLWVTKKFGKRGRWPLATYIHAKYRRRYELILDEAHQYAAPDSAQAQAAEKLLAGCRKGIAMTGTIYGGRASSIFYLLFRLDPNFRTVFDYGDAETFARMHGVFETAVTEDHRTTTNGWKKGSKKIRELPGVSPGMVAGLLPITYFMRLKDLGFNLPPYTEEVIEVEADERVVQALDTLVSRCKPEFRAHPEVTSQILQIGLGWPDYPEQAETVTMFDRDTSTTSTLAELEAIPDAALAKDVKLLEIVQEEIKAGRKVCVFFTQTHRRPAIKRIEAKLKEAGLRVAVLGPDVQANKREAWLTKHGGSLDVLLTNGALVETGLDLLFASTIIQYGIEYSVHRLRQSTRRSWRLGQTQPVKVIFLAYAGTMQAKAMSLIAKKMHAAELVDGDDLGGLAQFDEDGGDLLLELARDVSKTLDTREARAKSYVSRDYDKARSMPEAAWNEL